MSIAKAFRKISIVGRVATAYAVILLVVCGPLLTGPGFYAFGDADFPIRPWPLSNFLPFDAQSNLGYDNVYIGLPRILFLFFENMLFYVFHSTAAVSFGVYFAFMFLGMWGAYKLLRCLGAEPLIAGLAGALYVLNPWVAARVSQAPVILVYMAVPAFYASLIGLLRRPSFAQAAALGILAPVLLCAPNITYIVVAGAAIVFVVNQIVDNGRFVRRVAFVLLALGFACGVDAFFLFTAVSEALTGSTGALAHVASHYTFGSYLQFASMDGIANFIRYEGFLYAPWRQWPVVWQIALFIAPASICVVAVAALFRMRDLSRAGKIGLLSGIVMVLAAILFTQGATLMPGLIGNIWRTVPGFRILSDADYWGTLYSIGAIALLSGTSALQGHAGKIRWFLGVSLLAVSAPFWPGLGLFAKANPPTAYLDLPRTAARERTLWEPQAWASRYTWSPYMLTAWSTIAVPEESYGPYAAEITPPASYDFSAFLQDQFSNGTVSGIDPLLTAARTRYIIFTEDKINEPEFAPYSESEHFTLNHSLDDLVNGGGFLPFQSLRILSAPEDTTIRLTPALHWYAKYKPTLPGDFRGSVAVSTGSYLLSDLRFPTAWTHDSVTLLPTSTRPVLSGKVHWTVGFCEPNTYARMDGALVVQGQTLVATAGHHVRCATAPVLLMPGVHVFNVPVNPAGSPASGSLIGPHRNSPLGIAADGSLALTVRVSRAEQDTLLLFVQPGPGNRFSYGPPQDVLWPNGDLELLASKSPLRDLRSVFARAEEASSHVRILVNPHSVAAELYVARAPLYSNAAIDQYSMIVKDSKSDAVLSGGVPSPRMARTDALDGRAPLFRLSAPAELIVGYVSQPGLSTAGDAQVGASRIPLTSLLSRRAVTARQVKMLPFLRASNRFDSKNWTIGVCDGTKAGTGSLTFSRGTLVGVSGTRFWCVSHAEMWAPGVHDVKIPVNATNMVPSGVIVHDGEPAYFKWNGSDMLTARLTLQKASAVQVFLYVNPGNGGRLRYSGFQHGVWPFGNVLVTTVAAGAPSPAVLERIERQPLGYTAVLRNCVAGCVVVGSWSFSPIWMASIGGKDLPHVHANIYANAWIVPPQPGSVKIVVRYAAAPAYLAGLVTSAVFLLLLTALIVTGARAARGRQSPP